MNAETMGVREASDYLQLHQNTIRRYVKNGLLRALRAGQRGRFRLVRTDVQNLFQTNKNV